MSVRVQKFSIENHQTLLSLVDCYRRVFAGEPWHEWKKCPQCNKQWGIIDSLDICPNCDHNTVDFWPPEQVKREVEEQLSRPHCSSYVAMEHERVVGFCWGYSITPNELEKELGLPGLSQSLKQYFPGITDFAYQDEIGVDCDYRQQGFAREMFRQRLHDFRNNDIAVGVVRAKTMPPSVTYPWYARLGYSVVGSYNDIDARIVMAICFQNLNGL